MGKPKQLQNDSYWNQYDTDGDGVVTDNELDRSERMMALENMDKLQDQQRLMAWFALALPVALMMFMLLPFVDVDKVGAIMGIATTYVAAMGTIVTVFIGGTAYVKGKMSDNSPTTVIAPQPRGTAMSAPVASSAAPQPSWAPEPAPAAVEVGYGGRKAPPRQTEFPEI